MNQFYTQPLPVGAAGKLAEVFQGKDRNRYDRLPLRVLQQQSTVQSGYTGGSSGFTGFGQRRILSGNSFSLQEAIGPNGIMPEVIGSIKQSGYPIMNYIQEEALMSVQSALSNTMGRSNPSAVYGSGVYSNSVRNIYGQTNSIYNPIQSGSAAALQTKSYYPGQFGTAAQYGNPAQLKRNATEDISQIEPPSKRKMISSGFETNNYETGLDFTEE